MENNNGMINQQCILCIGEILWDALPGGLYLGGAPLNVCYHLNRQGIRAVIASRIGNDRLGKEALRRIKQKNIPHEYIQDDPDAETGFVEVTIGEDGEPAYDIVKPVAWDFIEKSPELEGLSDTCWAIVFGTLAQRSETTRNTIQALWSGSALNILDLNLRPPYDDEKVVHDSLRVADIVKMNEDELSRLKEWFSLPGNDREAVERLCDRFDCSLVCITKGAEGAMMYKENLWHEHSGYPVETKDTVGAGDAFFAAFIAGLRREMKGKELLAFANAAGSLVAQNDGATPEYAISDIDSIIT